MTNIEKIKKRFQTLSVTRQNIKRIFDEYRKMEEPAVREAMEEYLLARSTSALTKSEWVCLCGGYLIAMLNEGAGESPYPEERMADILKKVIPVMAHPDFILGSGELRQVMAASESLRDAYIDRLLKEAADGEKPFRVTAARRTLELLDIIGYSLTDRQVVSCVKAISLSGDRESLAQVYVLHPGLWNKLPPDAAERTAVTPEDIRKWLVHFFPYSKLRDETQVCRIASACASADNPEIREMLEDSLLTLSMTKLSTYELDRCLNTIKTTWGGNLPKSALERIIRDSVPEKIYFDSFLASKTIALEVVGDDRLTDLFLRKTEEGGNANGAWKFLQRCHVDYLTGETAPAEEQKRNKNSDSRCLDIILKNNIRGNIILEVILQLHKRRDILPPATLEKLTDALIERSLQWNGGTEIAEFLFRFDYSNPELADRMIEAYVRRVKPEDRTKTHGTNLKALLNHNRLISRLGEKIFSAPVDKDILQLFAPSGKHLGIIVERALVENDLYNQGQTKKNFPWPTTPWGPGDSPVPGYPRTGEERKIETLMDNILSVSEGKRQVALKLGPRAEQMLLSEMVNFLSGDASEENISKVKLFLAKTGAGLVNLHTPNPVPEADKLMVLLGTFEKERVVGEMVFDAECDLVL